MSSLPSWSCSSSTAAQCSSLATSTFISTIFATRMWSSSTIFSTHSGSFSRFTILLTSRGALSTPSSLGRTSQCRTYALDYLVSSPTIPCWFHNYSFRDRPSASLTSVRVPGRASTKTASAESFWPAVFVCHRRHMHIIWHTGRRAARTIRYHATRPPGQTRSVSNCTSPMSADYTDCAKAKRRTRAFKRRYRRTKLDSDWLVWIGQARKKQQLFAAKQNQFWEKKISDSKGDPKKLWWHLSGVLRKVKSKPPNSGELTAERFSDAFQEKLAGVRSATASAAPPVFNGPPCAFNMAGFEPIDSAAAQRLISNAACKSSELDPVPTWVIQKFAVELSPFIAALFNASMSGGYFLASQKIASITPILKKASLDPLHLGNYRPIWMNWMNWYFIAIPPLKDVFRTTSSGIR